MSYTCPKCGSVSQSTQDEINKYCGHCHVFEPDAEVATLRQIMLIPVKHEGMPSHVRRAARAAITVRHTMMACPLCKQDCWIGPVQRVVLEAGFGDAACSICMVAMAETDDAMRRALYSPVAVNPGIEQERRRLL